MDAKDIRNLQEAYSEVYRELDEAEGSYGQTPKARAAMSSLAQSRAAKPASEYGKRGEKSRKVKAAEKHAERMTTKPHQGRGPMGPKEREHSRGMGEIGSGRFYSASGGTVTKNPKKLRKQKAMGEIGEQVDIYDIILSHLLDEGYAETPEAAEVIMVNMSEEWRDSIIG